MKKQLLVLGAGQLGSRYLQGIAKVKEGVEIHVVDTYEKSLERAMEMYKQSNEHEDHEIHLHQNIERIPKNIDLAIIATTANCRTEMITKITEKHQTKAWIIEKLLAQSSNQVNQITRKLGSNERVWVNTPRRIMKWHKRIVEKLDLKENDQVFVKISGSNWGMACNAIHFIDLVCWWTGSKVVGVACSNENRWEESKRIGFVEIFGRIKVEFENKSFLYLECNNYDEKLQIEVTTKRGRWRIDETKGLATGPEGQTVEGRLSMQSELTAPLVEGIMQEGKCGLPDLRESAAQHRPLLDTLLVHWNYSNACDSKIVPIT